jgi:hypothetical protein
MDGETHQETWEIEAGGQTYTASFDEMASWIGEGALLRIDRVRKGNLRWIEAGKVPSLTEFFNAKDMGRPITPTVTISQPEAEYTPVNTVADVAAPPTAQSMPDACAMHADVAAAYVCDTCANAFCKACPSSYGGTVKICPFCGAMCKSLEQVVKKQAEATQRHHAITSGFGFGDFGKAIAYPFKFKWSLLFGAVMFTFFSIGQGAVGFGGIIMMASAIFCFLLANMLTFGILANTVDNFTQGRLDENFMPSFDDFSIWDDVIHPFFLMIGVYISSFGPFIVVMVVALFFMLGAVKSEMNGVQSDAARTVDPGLPYAANAAKQSEAVRDLLNKTKDMQQKRVEAIERKRESYEAQMDAVDRGEEYKEPVNPAAQAAADEEKDFAEMNKLIQDTRKAQLESAIGKTPETVAAEQQAMIKQILGYGILFLVLAGITALWGFFYFPAACAVAGYTRSFTATINPAVGLDTIRRLGGTYAMILLMGFLLLVASSIVGGVLSMIFLPFDMPAVGNIPAKIFGSMFGFYLSVVFACIIGYALYKASDRLKLYT